MGKRKSLKRVWAVSEKLEAVQAFQNGLTQLEVSGLYGMSPTAVRAWAKKYENGGLAALENAQGRVRAPASPKVEAAAAVDDQFHIAPLPHNGATRLKVAASSPAGGKIPPLVNNNKNRYCKIYVIVIYYPYIDNVIYVMICLNQSKSFARR